MTTELSFIEEQIHREAQLFALNWITLALRAQSVDVFLRATIVPNSLDWSMHRAATTAQTRQSGDTHLIISREHYDL